MPYTLLEPALYLQATVGASLTNSTSSVDISTNPQYVMPPNTITTVGQTLILRAGGVLSAAASSQGNVGIGFFKNTQTTAGATGVGGATFTAGNTLAAISTSTALTASAATWIWMAEAYVNFTAVGTSGSVFTYGWVDLPTSATAVTHIPMPNTTPQTALTFDTTKPTLLTVGAIFSAASASNILVCNQFNVRVMT